MNLRKNTNINCILLFKMNITGQVSWWSWFINSFSEKCIFPCASDESLQAMSDNSGRTQNTRERNLLYAVHIFSSSDITFLGHYCNHTHTRNSIFFSTNLDFLGEVINAIYEGIFYYYLKWGDSLRTVFRKK